MTCLHPLLAAPYALPNENGKIEYKVYGAIENIDSVALSALKTHSHAIPIPCGQCLGCRLDKANEWAIRCVHEAKLYTHNCFLTLTYNDDNLPSDNSLHREHLQKFIKRLRRNLEYHEKDVKIRFLACGEYGSVSMRPHYHILCFGWFPPDVRKLSALTSGYNLFRSPLVEQLWPYGYNTVGAVTFESARYVAKYSLKKQTGNNAAMYDMLGITPEFVACSLKPGIGANYFSKHDEDIITQGFCVVNGAKYKIPDYYLKLFDRKNPVWCEIFKEQRRLNVSDDVDLYRLQAREKILQKRQQAFERSLDALG